jgi:hypothetical protein
MYTNALVSLLVCLLSLTRVSAFAPVQVPPTLPAIVESVAITRSDAAQSPLTIGVNNYLSSSTLVSLQERKPVTAEEIAAKKRNFNIIFWGGGIIAPFIATVFYFGFKFWEK